MTLKYRGKTGSATWTTVGAPTNDVGEDGDISINTQNWILHGPKANNDWSTSPTRAISKTQLRFNSSRAPLDATDGNDGDVWIFIQGGDLVFQKKTSGSWSEVLRFTGASASVTTNDGSGGGDGGGD